MLRHHHQDGLSQKRKAEQLHEFVQVISADLQFQSLDQALDLLDTQQMRNGVSRVVSRPRFGCLLVPTGAHCKYMVTCF